MRRADTTSEWIAAEKTLAWNNAEACRAPSPVLLPGCTVGTAQPLRTLTRTRCAPTHCSACATISTARQFQLLVSGAAIETPVPLSTPSRAVRQPLCHFARVYLWTLVALLTCCAPRLVALFSQTI